jgi:hypothetical protein
MNLGAVFLCFYEKIENYGYIPANNFLMPTKFIALIAFSLKRCSERYILTGTHFVPGPKLSVFTKSFLFCGFLLLKMVK